MLQFFSSNDSINDADMYIVWRGLDAEFRKETQSIWNYVSTLASCVATNSEGISRSGPDLPDEEEINADNNQQSDQYIDNKLILSGYALKRLLLLFDSIHSSNKYNYIKKYAPLWLYYIPAPFRDNDVSLDTLPKNMHTENIKSIAYTKWVSDELLPLVIQHVITEFYLKQKPVSLSEVSGMFSSDVELGALNKLILGQVLKVIDSDYLVLNKDYILQVTIKVIFYLMQGGCVSFDNLVAHVRSSSSYQAAAIEFVICLLIYKSIIINYTMQTGGATCLSGHSCLMLNNDVLSNLVYDLCINNKLIAQIFPSEEIISVSDINIKESNSSNETDNTEEEEE